jgi:hypothetical protein
MRAIATVLCIYAALASADETNCFAPQMTSEQSDACLAAKGERELERREAAQRDEAQKLAQEEAHLREQVRAFREYQANLVAR